jgi:hypothetical protein
MTSDFEMFSMQNTPAINTDRIFEEAVGGNPGRCSS